ncbi:MAG: UDP-2,3-diacylglucosamine diphosphatase [Prolixibacteraceae bacterium]
MQKAIRKPDISVISDVHLATMASKAKFLLSYLKSIHPGTLVLNGDIIDSWRFNRNYFPKPHLKVIRRLVKMIENGVQVVYITGNHDDVFRKFNNIRLGNFSIVNQLEITTGDRKVWIFHGDVFDHIIHHFTWLARFGAAAYAWLTGLNRMLNAVLKLFGGKEMILYKSMKERILKEKKVLTNFELAVANAAVNKKADLVICGHTHIPTDKTIATEKGTVRYLNCGDWIENFSMVECTDGKWELKYFNGDLDEEEPDDLDIPDKEQLYRSILTELNVILPA